MSTRAHLCDAPPCDEEHRDGGGLEEGRDEGAIDFLVRPLADCLAQRKVVGLGEDEEDGGRREQHCARRSGQPLVSPNTNVDGGRTEGFGLFEDSNDDHNLDDEVDEGCYGRPNDRQDERPHGVERRWWGGLEERRDGEANVEEDVRRADGEDY